jgi:hypothetical protein
MSEEMSRRKALSLLGSALGFALTLSVSEDADAQTSETPAACSRDPRYWCAPYL